MKLLKTKGLTVAHVRSVGAGVPLSVQCLTTDWTTGVWSPAETKSFSSSLCVQTSSEAHLASYPMVLIHGVKRGMGVTQTTHDPIHCWGQEWVGGIPPLLLSSCMACCWTAFSFYIYKLHYMYVINTLK
jgi:hypothetical protein